MIDSRSLDIHPETMHCRHLFSEKNGYMVSILQGIELLVKRILRILTLLLPHLSFLLLKDHLFPYMLNQDRSKYLRQLQDVNIYWERVKMLYSVETLLLHVSVNVQRTILELICKM